MKKKKNKQNKLGQLLVKHDTREKFKVGRDIATFRQWYYSMSIADRQRFKQDMRGLVEASKRVASACITVVVNYERTWHDHEGDSDYSETAKRTPAEILRAIDEWDEADEQDTASELFL